MQFKAFRIETEPELKKSIQIMSKSDLPQSEVLVDVHYSSLNYKDALSAIGNKGVTRNYPHTPGIDASGIVIQSNDLTWKKGDRVIITGFDFGMNTDGGLAQLACVPAKWIVKCPDELSLKDAMSYGTAGFTAALSVLKIVSNLKEEDGDILVTGSTGGVGSTAIAILSKLGYRVVATTGKPEYITYLNDLGAKEIISREEADDHSGKAMLKSRWAGVIDTVGGNILATALKSTQYMGHVTCCGNVASHEFQGSVYPFILKGITLHGIDSVQCPMATRLKIWTLLSNEWYVPALIESTEEIGLDDVEKILASMLEGKHKGRTIVNLKA